MVRTSTCAVPESCSTAFKISSPSEVRSPPSRLLASCFVIRLYLLGLNSGTEVIVNGGSAGGLAVVLHLDAIAQALPNSIVRGVSEAGYFLNFRDVKVPFPWFLLPSIMLLYFIFRATISIENKSSMLFKCKRSHRA